MNANTKLRVLLVEDDEEMATQVKRLLVKHFSAEIQFTLLAEKALQMFETGQFDLVLLDYQLSDGDGLSILREITSREGHPPAVMVTGHGDEETAVQAFRAGAAGYVVKDQRLPTMLPDVINKALAVVKYESAKVDLEAARERIALVTESLPIPFACIDRELRYVNANGPYAEFFSSVPEQMLGLNMRHFLGEEAFSRALPNIEAVLDGTMVTFDQMLEIEGVLHYFKVKLVPEQPTTGRIGGFYSFVIDVTDERAALAALRASEREYRELVETANSIILKADRDGRITYMNDFGLKFFGYEPEEIIGKHAVGTIVPESVRAGTEEEIVKSNSQASGGQPDCYTAGCPEGGESPWPRGTSYITTALFQAPALLGAWALLKKAPLRLPVFGAIWVAIATVVRKVICCRCEYYGKDCSTIMGKWTAMLYEKDEEHPLTTEAFYLDFGLVAASILFPLPQVRKMGIRYLALYLAVALASTAGIRHFGCRYCPNTVCFMNPDHRS